MFVMFLAIMFGVGAAFGMFLYIDSFTDQKAPGQAINTGLLVACVVLLAGITIKMNM